MPANSQLATITVGSSPLGVAYDPGKGEIFAVNQGSNSVSVIDDSTNAVTATVGVGSSPSAAVYDSGKGEVFVANLISDTVSVIDDATNSVVATVTVGSNPVALAYDSGKGEIFVANSNSHSVSVISDSSNTVVATVAFTGSNPNGLAYDSGANEVFVSLLSTSSNQVKVISDSSNTVVATVNVGASPAGLAYDSGRGEVWVADSGTSLVSVISDSNNTAWASITVGSGPESLAYDPSTGYLFEPSTGASTLGALGDSALDEINVINEPGSDGAQGVAYDAGTNEVFVADSSGGSVDVFPAGSGPSTSFSVTGVLTLHPTGGTVGTTVTADGVGFLAGGTVTVTVGGNPVTTTPNPCKASNSGVFSCTFPFPASPAGPNTVSAATGTLSASASFTVGPSLLLTPTGGPVASVTYANGTGFAATSAISITFGSAGVSTAPSMCPTSAVGSFSCTFVVPNLAIGPYTVTATDGTNSAFQPYTITSSVPPYQVERTVNPASYTFADVGSEGVGQNPQDAVYDAGNGYVYVDSIPANGAPDSVTVVNPATLNSGGVNSVVTTINVASPTLSYPPGNTVSSCIEPVGEAYDFGTNTIWVVCYYTNNVDVIADSGPYANHVIDTITLSAPCLDPWEDAYDSADSEVYVTMASSNDVCALSDSNYAATPTAISVGHPTLGIAYDSSSQQLYISANTANLILDLAPSFSNSVTPYTVSNPWGVAYDSGQGQIWVTICSNFPTCVGFSTGTVQVYAATTAFTSLGSATVGADPEWDWYDAGQGQVAVTGTGTYVDDLTLVNDTAPITGLPAFHVSLSSSTSSGAEGVTFDTALNEIWVADTNGIPPAPSSTVDEVTANANPSGLGAFGAAYDPGSSMIYVTNPGADTLTIFSDSTLGLMGAVSSLPSSPYAIADGNGYLAVSCPASGTVELFDATSPSSAVATLYTTGTPQNITYDPTTQDFYVAESGASRIGWLSTSSIGTVGETAVGAPSTFVAYDAALSELFVGSPSSSIIEVYSVSGASLSLVGSVSLPTGASPAGIAYDAAFGEMFVTVNNQALVTVIDDATLTTVGSGVTVGTGPSGIAYDSAKGLLFMVNTDPNFVGSAGSVSVIDERSDTVIATVSVGYGPFMLAYDSGLGEMFVVNAYAGTMSVLAA